MIFPDTPPVLTVDERRLLDINSVELGDRVVARNGDHDGLTFLGRSDRWLVRRLVGRLIGWLDRRLICRIQRWRYRGLVGRMFRWLDCRLVRRLIGWLICRLICRTDSRR